MTRQTLRSRVGGVGRRGRGGVPGGDVGDVVDADEDPGSPEQAGSDLERFGLVCRFSVADAGDAADPFGRGFDEEALAAAEPVAAVVAGAGRAVPLV